MGTGTLHPEEQRDLRTIELQVHEEGVKIDLHLTSKDISSYVCHYFIPSRKGNAIPLPLVGDNPPPPPFPPQVYSTPATNGIKGQGTQLHRQLIFE